MIPAVPTLSNVPSDHRLRNLRPGIDAILPHKLPELLVFRWCEFHSRNPFVAEGEGGIETRQHVKRLTGIRKSKSYSN
jgi:hypothetical protein